MDELFKKYNTLRNCMSFTLNNTCNKKCPYCIGRVPFSTKRELSKEVEDRIYKYLPYIYKKCRKNDFRIMLSGGEPGMLPDHMLDYILKNFTWDLFNSNGTIFKRESYKKYKYNINKLIYHISPDINSNMYIPKIDEDNINYIIVIHKENIKYLESFLKLNNHINFEIELNVANYFESVQYIKLILSDQDIIKIGNIIEKFDNINLTSKGRIIGRCIEINESNSDIQLKKLCHAKRNLNINFYNNNITPCSLCKFDPETFNDINKEIIDNITETVKADKIDFNHCLKCKRYINS